MQETNIPRRSGSLYHLLIAPSRKFVTVTTMREYIEGYFFCVVLFSDQKIECFFFIVFIKSAQYR